MAPNPITPSSNKRCISLASIVILLCLVQPCSSFSLVPFTKKNTFPQLPRRYRSRHLNSRPGNKDTDDVEAQASTKDELAESTSYSWAELQADPELSQLERKSSMQRKNTMLLPQRISQATGIVAWSFVIGGIILNALGYAWVRDPSGGIGIGTLKWVCVESVVSFMLIIIPCDCT